MARILQDGFETEGKEFNTTAVQEVLNLDMDIARFILKISSESGYHGIKRGICAPRGGYGQKGFSFDISCSNYGYWNTSGLKYDLTKNCNDTSELYCRVWINPQLTQSAYNVDESRITALALSDVEFDRVIDSNYNTTKFNQNCNCVLSIEKIDADTYLLNCYCAGALVYSYNYLFYNQWIKLDVRLKVGDAQNGIFQLRINDKLITTFNGLTGTNNPTYLYIGKPISSGRTGYKCDVDDIAVNDTTGNVNNSWCGNGSIVGLVPTANGSKTMFTPGIEDTQNFENVDELVPDGDVTYNSSYALNDIDLFIFTIPEELGIPATETINAITVSTSAKFVEQPTDIGHIVSDGTTETLIKQHVLSNDYISQSSIIQEKSAGTKYKVSDIENLEFGYKTLESSQAQEE